MRLSNLKFAVLSLSLIAAPAAFADTATYATILSAPTNGATASATATIGSTGFAFTGQNANTLTYDPWPGGNYTTSQPAGTFTSATVTNAPPSNAFFQFNAAGVETFIFNTPVTNLVLAEYSLGGGGTTTTYSFNDTFSVLSCGADGPYGGGCFSSGGVGTSGMNLSGDESSGVIEFAGPITTLSFTITNGEGYNGFDLGILAPTTSATPEPGSLLLVGTGLAGLAGAVRRRFAR